MKTYVRYLNILTGCLLLAFNLNAYAFTSCLSDNDPDTPTVECETILTDCSVVGEIPEAECDELLHLWNSTGGSTWTNAATNQWNNTNLPCTWQGVTCSDQPNPKHVIAIDLSNNNVTGKLVELNLPNLQRLVLSKNKLSGAILDFGDLPALQTLDLQNNQLAGAVPNFGSLPALQTLMLGNNQLAGAIPDFSDIPKLQTLDLQNNQLTGSIPNLSGLTLLKTLNLSNNRLTGTIPDFGDISNLNTLNLQNNLLSGALPNFSGMTALQTLNLSHNQLSGTLPDFSDMTSLRTLNLQSNQLGGSIPNFSGFGFLQTLDLQSNQLKNQIPDFDGMPYLQALLLANNQLSGVLPTLEGLPKLKTLSLNNNQLSGDTPSSDSLAILQKLDSLSLNANCIVPTEAAVLTLLDSKNPDWKTTQKTGCATPTFAARLINISTRCTLAASPNNGVAGFIILGSGKKRVLLRAIRSAIEPNTGFDLKMSLYQLNNGAAATKLAENDDWQSSPNEEDILALSANLIPASTKDAALIIELSPGVYTIEAEPLSGSGVGTISVDDLDDYSASSTLKNISGRCNVGSDNLRNAVAGFIIAGEGQLIGLLRGIKSAIELGSFDPKMTVHQQVNGQFQVLDSNDNWATHSSAAQVKTLAANYVPANSTDAAMMQILRAGVYTMTIAPNSNAGVSTVSVDVP